MLITGYNFSGTHPWTCFLRESLGGLLDWAGSDLNYDWGPLHLLGLALVTAL